MMRKVTARELSCLLVLFSMAIGCYSSQSKSGDSSTSSTDGLKQTDAPKRSPRRALPPQTAAGLKLDIPSKPIDVESAPYDEDWLDVAAIDPARVVYSDTFSNMGGHICSSIDGRRVVQGLGATSRMLSIFSAPTDGQACVLRLSEDMTTLGPDGQPGVLSIQWATLPSRLDYSVFLYAGQRTDHLFAIPAISNASTIEDLDGIKFRCKFKGRQASNRETSNIVFDLRLCIDGEDLFENRLELGRLTATDAWQTHQVDLSSRKNTSNFLASLDRLRLNRLQIMVGQVGPIDNYHSGDMLLIDDIEVIVPERLIGMRANVISPSAEQWIDSSTIDPERIAFSDSFTDTKPCVHRVANNNWTIDGVANGTRNLAMFVDPETVGNYALLFSEEPNAIGPDGQPGVLSIAIDPVPSKMDYFGFMYMGYRKSPDFGCQAISKARSKQDLSGIKLRFKSKSINRQSNQPHAIDLGVRIEPTGGNQHANRLEFGWINVTTDWQNHQFDLGTGVNAERFLSAMVSRIELGLRLILSQSGSIQNYQTGDAVLIDDVELIVPSASQSN